MYVTVGRERKKERRKIPSFVNAPMQKCTIFRGSFVKYPTSSELLHKRFAYLMEWLKADKTYTLSNTIEIE